MTNMPIRTTNACSLYFYNQGGIGDFVLAQLYACINNLEALLLLICGVSKSVLKKKKSDEQNFFVFPKLTIHSLQ